MSSFLSSVVSTSNADECQDPFPASELPVWIMGKQLSSINGSEELLSRVCSRLWISYRHNFPEIGDSGLTSDKGWGCMLRCGQMVLAEALIRLHLGSDWIWHTDCKDNKYLDILKLFEDTKDAIYGIHRISLMGESTDGKAVGTWFGPNTVAQAIRKLSAYDTDNNLNVFVAMDNTVVMDEIREASRGQNDTWKTLLLFVPLRLGLTEVNSIYHSDLKDCLEMPQSIGVIGGRPNHALYFIGYVDDDLVYLDPHTSQVAGQVGTKSSEEEVLLDKSYHTENAARLNLTQLDPSLSLCFFCKSELEFDDLCERLLRRIILGHTSPLFEICRERPHLSLQENLEDSEDKQDQGASAIVANTRQYDTSDDEFEIIL